ncbi:SPW repeat domain-containing protein [Dyadobacter sp. MSC1_007]|jgi:hypothetical protein|uniref:SPW repeat domain-containing protein n=1 Tax=Dyadobacter sp. MSC1_007 TaxID=2909264 RepID=UPI0020308973|nr:SPW repeat protein [Dyadobacter sp. MSC1_007]
MKLFSTSTHAKIDYLASIFFMASPWIFGFKESVPATWTMIAIGLMALLMSLFTDYEGGMVRSIPMRVHLTADVFAGAFLASSPWLFGFADEVFLPHMVMGLFEVSAGLLTSKHPSRDRSGAVVDHGGDEFN